MFMCSVLSNPPATVSWAFGHPPQSLSTNQRIVVANTTLTINNVRSSDEGFYECIANNSYGRNSTSGRLTIAGSNDSFQMGISVLVLVVSIIVISYRLILRISRNANMYRVESLVSFVRKHDVIKIGQKQKGNRLRVVQPTMLQRSVCMIFDTR